MARDHVAALFAPEDVKTAEQMLVHHLSGEDSILQSMDRICFVAIRLSGGTLAGLRQAIVLYNADWRDLLVASGFGDDVNAHTKWKPRRFDLDIDARWRNGDLPAGVTFGRKQPVHVYAWPSTGDRGTVISLLALEPEPRYLVEFTSGEQARIWQSRLRDAA